MTSMVPDRAVSTTVGVTMMIGIVVVMGSVFAAFSLGFADRTNEPAPVVAQSSGEFQQDVPGAGVSDQRVRLDHDAGDPVDVSEIAILVEFPNHPERAHLVNLPTNRITSENERADGIVDSSWDGINGSIDANEDDGVWSAGETIAFEINNGAVRLDRGERVVVTVVHAPSNSVLMEATLVADDG